MQEPADSVFKLKPEGQGLSLVVINYDTQKIVEFTDFIMVGFSDEREYVANNCTLQQVAQGLSRLHDLYDELVAEVQARDKPKLRMLAK
ncbi:hypothetical protein [Desulfosporosinus meridiei]|uniref:Uncharacterized protein n=1 Tax=Desulfosporosinus meridiei (strain ATCC BAA-275 / DSM 13257 / KCTC 12902 / NCIMB 13706 / S10) TaxID=768704 RepID=J7ITQ6_DESMD|nr:hypothetical protein [Desulfosporosinus meridiei]AFQ42488.1 hypothetical protein Desmer_0438 [Desulfosporosinus meridiei DSM 13257]